MRVPQGEIFEVKEICNKLNRENKQYVLAVANALKFSQENAKKHHHSKEESPG